MTKPATRKRAILVLDDDVLLGETLSDALTTESDEVVCAHSGAEGVAICSRRIIDIVLLDQQLPDGKGAELCKPILEHNENAKIVFMTAFPSFENAVTALKFGACDYLAKPFEIGELQLSIDNCKRLLEFENIERLLCRRRQKEAVDSAVIGSSGPLRNTLELATRAARAGAGVLILGETGTGKTLLARHIHYQGRNPSAPFVSLNCAALPDSLAESELFGHERGAFTSAETARRGIFEMAENGTVLLDEIGAMALPLQAKLLGVLEDREVRRLGGERRRPVSALIIAATNSDLEVAVAEGTFRRDLYFRLGVVPVRMPTLRERTTDLPELCAHLCRSICGRPLDLGDGEIDRLASYDWPGNVRELKNVLERALILQGEEAFRPSQFLMAAAVPKHSTQPPLSGSPKTLEAVEQQHIDRVLADNSGNLTRTAKELGIALTTLKRKIKSSV